MNKIDRDRRKKKKQPAFDVVEWNAKQDAHHANLSNWFMGRMSEIKEFQLTKWESNFINGLFDQIVNKGRPITSKQAVYFDRLYLDLKGRSR